MSFLFPLFLAGIAVIAAPIILHMIRRHTRKRITFSSLLFLHTTAPRFKNRKKLEDIILLILRCAVLILLAIAFSRPFLHKSEQENTANSTGKRVVLLIDTSASMKQPGLWEQAVSQAQTVIGDMEPSDRLCIMSFDKDIQTLVSFDSWSQTDQQLRISSARQALNTLSPDWSSTSLGNALVSAAEAIEDDEVNIQTNITERRIILISDIQQGCDIDALHNYEWPDGLELTINTIRPQETTNAAIQVLAKSNYTLQADDKKELNVRITNSANAKKEHFQLRWASLQSDNNQDKPVDVYVPAGGSIVTKVPAESNNITAGRLILSGDDNNFDDILYLAPNLKQQADILYVGDDEPNDSRGMLYYLRRAFQQTNIFKPQIVASNKISEMDILAAQLIIITDTIKPEIIESLRQQLRAGDTVLLVMKTADSAATITDLCRSEAIKAGEAEVRDYSMLAQIEFEHPLLSIFSEPRYRDFTKIHFWKYRKVNIDNLPQARVLARFDNQDPAIFELPVENGTLLVFTSSWQPSDSQLALSSKFVPLLYSILEYGSAFDVRKSQYYVGDKIRIPSTDTRENAEITVRSPDGSQTRLNPRTQLFSKTDQPGIYNVQTPDSNQIFAVNIPIRESLTAPMSLDELEQYCTSLQNNLPTATAEQIKHKKQYSSIAEMENGQKLWRFVFVAIFAVLIIETLLAGWMTHPAKTVQEKTNEINH
jgi:hypothetical protein